MRFGKYLGVLLVCAGILALLGGCDFIQNSHTHSFSKWAVTKAPSCVDQGVQSRQCEECGYMETDKIIANGHTTVKDAAVSASCTSDGLTEGSHCSVCGQVMVAQQSISAYGHAPLKDYPIAPTCTAEGLSEGSHCALCGVVIVAQTAEPALGHLYENITVVLEANCSQDGVRKFSCVRCEASYVESYTSTAHTAEVVPAVAPDCETPGLTEGSKCKYCNIVLTVQNPIPATGHSYGQGVVVLEATCQQDGVLRFSCENCTDYYEEMFPLAQKTAEQIRAEAQQYVGQIVTFDKSGQQHKTGIGFIYTADGQIITTFQVIDGAYSAQITIDGVVYPVAGVLAYDRTLDLAILKIAAAKLPTANVCTNPVEVGDVVFAFASNRGITVSSNQGAITFADRVLGGVTFLQHDATLTPESAGSPLINIYGEVIGINTLSVSETGDLNFAVFSRELEKLVYGEMLTMDAFYEKECVSAHDKLMEYVLSNGTADEYGNYFLTEENQTASAVMTYALCWDSQNNLLSLQVTVVTSSGYTTQLRMILSGDPGQMYYSGAYGAGGEWYNTASGLFDAGTFYSGTKLECNEYVGLESVKEELLVRYRDAIHQSISWLNRYLPTQNLSFTAVDLGFTNYT